MELTQDQWHAIHSICLHLYGTSDLSQLRKTFLEEVNEIIPHDKSFFDVAHYEGGSVDFFDPITATMKKKELEDYYNEYMAADYVGWLFQKGGSVVYRDSDVIANEVREQTVIYKDWLRPMGVYYGLGSSISQNNILYGSVTFFRKKESGDFSAEEVYMLKLLTEHLSNHFAQMYPKGIKKQTTRDGNGKLVGRYQLSNRECQVLGCVCQGLSNRDVARTLCIAENTVKKHISNIFNKMDVTNRTQLTTLIYKNQDDYEGFLPNYSKFIPLD